MTAGREWAARLTAGVAGPVALVVVLVWAGGTVLMALPVAPSPEERWVRALGQVGTVAVVVTLVALALTVAWTARRADDGRVAAAAALLALAWAAVTPALVAADRPVRAVATVAAALVPAALLHLVTAWRPGVLLLAYVALAVLAVLHVLSRDPFLDPDCVLRCEPEAPVIAAPALATASATTLRLAGTVLGLAVVAAAVVAVRRSTRERTTLLLAVPAAAAEVVWAGVAPAHAVLGAPLPLRAAGHLVLGVGLLVVTVLRLRRRSALRRMAREIAEVTPPRTAADVVGVRLRDPTARLEFHVPADGTWVDAEGRHVEDPGDAAGRHTVVLRRGGRTLARIRTTGVPPATAELEDALGPATLLAVEAERTRSEARLRLAQLRDTRRRLVEVADTARRRAERDLHDGAQHRLLAATFALEDAAAAARDDGDDGLEEEVRAALGELREVSAGLRRLAHGIYPVVLRDGGLVAALEGLARTSEVPLTVDATRVPRVDPPVELTAWAAVVLAGRAADAEALHVRVSHDASTLRLVVEGANVGGAGAEAISDRAAALGGTMSTMGRTLTLDLPCG